MADYSWVRDPNGTVVGMWIRDPTGLDKPGLLETLLATGAPDLLGEYISKRYRKVTNAYNSSGGCFVMFGSSKAPGE
jgi:hypothetical protein